MDKGDTVINRSTQGSKTAALRAYAHLIASRCSDLLPWQKWFYLNSRRKWAKHLPRAAFEGIGADQIRVERVINRSHPVKQCLWGCLSAPSLKKTSMSWLSWWWVAPNPWWPSLHPWTIYNYQQLLWPRWWCGRNIVFSISKLSKRAKAMGSF